MALSGVRAVLLILALPVAAAVRSGGAAAARQPAGTTPVQKVIELLKKLTTQVEADGKREAAEYDKYACFCKEQADQKLYAIEKSTKKLAALGAEIGELQTDIADLTTGISELVTKITGLEGDIKNASDARKAENLVYQGKEADTSGAISALKRAITALKESKVEMSGKVALEAALPQLRAAAHHAALSLAQKRLLGAKPGEAYEYEYHANDIVATLEGLLITFTETKDRLDREEFEANANFEKKKQGLEHEKTAAEKEKLEKEKLEAMKSERLNEANGEEQVEEADKKADQSFMSTLKDSCEEKAALWDDRSKTRAAELTAISQAMEALQTGVVPNWAANRKLVGLQQKQAVQPPAFLQLRGSSHGQHGSGGFSSKEEVRQMVLKALRASAVELHSPALSVAALRVQVSEDHFEKVRSIIKDLVARLEAQAQAEAGTKSFCDDSMAAAVASRDKKQEEVEGHSAKISEKEAMKAKLLQEIAVLGSDIADNMKALEEATELRANEKKDNANVMAEAQAGKAAVEYALQVLKKFYDSQSASFAQEATAYVPPNSDRSGKTLGDLAPEVFDSKYSGRQQASGGIIGLLEVILADFSRTDTTVDAQEKQADGDFTTFKTSIEADTKAKTADKVKKEGEVKSLEDDLVKLTDLNTDAMKAHGLANKELEKLQKMCVAGEETYEERVATREKEIEALKQAHDILENWQG